MLDKNAEISATLTFLEEATTKLSVFELPWVAEKYIQRGGLSVEKLDAYIKTGDSLDLVPQIIKIDVEGAEHSVLQGMKNIISKYSPIVFAESSDWHNVTLFLGEY